MRSFTKASGGLVLRVFIAQEGVDATAENFGSFALAEVEFLAHVDDESRINDGCVDLFVKCLHFAHDTFSFGVMSAVRISFLAKFQPRFFKFQLLGAGF